MAVSCVINEYFDKHRHLALSFISIGSSIGVFIFPPLFEYLIDAFSWRGAMLINTGIAAQMLIFGATMLNVQIKKEKRKNYAKFAIVKYFGTFA